MSHHCQPNAKRGLVHRLWMLVQCLLVWRMPESTEDQRADAQAVVTQAVEYNRDGSPGPGNEILADIAISMSRWNGNLPVIAQIEVARVLPTHAWHASVGANPDHGFAPGRPATTRQVCTEQAEICRRQGWVDVIVVTFPEHMWRTCMAYRRFGLNPIAAPMPRFAEYYHPGACRWYMRGKWRFVAYELLARVYFWLKGWI